MPATTVETHPVAAIFPMLAGEELQHLADDIASQGLLHPVVLDDQGRVLDGRNRLAACEIARVRPRFTKYHGDDPIGYAVSVNIRRRHLNPDQQAFVALAVLPHYEKQAEANKGGRPSKNKEKPEAPGPQVKEKQKRAPQARDLAAKAAGASGRSVARAKRLDEQAPDLAEKVKSGELALKRAERILRDKEAEEKRLQQAREDEANTPEQPNADIRAGDFREVFADLKQVDAIITDPPYPAEYLPLLDDLAAWANRVLTPDGVMLVLFGQHHLEEAMRRLSGHRPYRWTLAYLTPGAGYVAHSAGIQSHWKPVLVYGKGPRADDVITSTDHAVSAKQHHEWGQDSAGFAELVRRFTRPGDTVCDPFAGSGTTLLAARAAGRHVVGAEIDPEHYETMRRRLQL